MKVVDLHLLTLKRQVTQLFFELVFRIARFPWKTPFILGIFSSVASLGRSTLVVNQKLPNIFSSQLSVHFVCFWFAKYSFIKFHILTRYDFFRNIYFLTLPRNCIDKCRRTRLSSIKRGPSHLYETPEYLVHVENANFRHNSALPKLTHFYVLRLQTNFLIDFVCVFSIFISFVAPSFFARSEAFVQVLSACDQHNQVYFKVQIPGSEKKGFAAHSLAFFSFRCFFYVLNHTQYALLTKSEVKN